MDTVDREALVKLAEYHGWPAVSIYQPTHRTGPEALQDPLRLKNLLKQAEVALQEGGMRTPDIRDLLDRAWRLHSDTGFWRDGFEGLGIFIAKDLFHVFRTTKPLTERLRVGEHFLIRPLLPALDSPLRFMILALSMKRVRLLEGTVNEVREVDPAGIPQGLAEALKWEDYENQVQFHSGTSGATGHVGRRAAMFHGHGGHTDTMKDGLDRYFRLVDKALKEHIGPSGTPLVLAGVDYLLPVYQSASTYPDLLPDGITGNPDELPAAALHASALKVLAPHLRQQFEDDLASLEEARQNHTASEDVSDIVLAAHAGRVQTLFVTDTEDVWGQIVPETASVTPVDQRGPGDADLLDRATAQTLLHGGAVHVMSADEVSSAIGNSAAAVMRY